MSSLTNMQRRIVSPVIIALGIAAWATSASAADFAETSYGEFGDEPTAPTEIVPSLDEGTNTISGFVDAYWVGMDHDYVRVSLPSDSRLASVKLKVTTYNSFLATEGVFEILPPEAGNSGSVIVDGINDYQVAFTIGDRTNIVLHIVPPFVLDFTGSASFDYQVELVVATVEVAAGTQIYTAVEVTCPTEVNAQYQLQCTPDIASDAWTDLGDPVPGDGSTMSFFDTTRRADKMFYRVLKQ